MECTKRKLQYVSKAETELNLSNLCKDVLKVNEIAADQHFAQKDPDFNTQAKFTVSKHKAKQRKHHRNTQKACELLNKKAINSPFKRTSH